MGNPFPTLWEGSLRSPEDYRNTRTAGMVNLHHEPSRMAGMSGEPKLGENDEVGHLVRVGYRPKDVEDAVQINPRVGVADVRFAQEQRPRHRHDGRTHG